jgi:capsular exopolysaccharide synthesis family protein
VNDVASSLIVAPGAAAGIIQISLESTNPQQGADIINDLMKEYQVATREDKNETNRRMLVFIDGRLKDVGRELDSITGRYLAYQRANNIIGDVETQSSGYISRLETAEEQINELRVESDMAVTLDAYLRDRKNAYNLVPSTFGLKDGTLSTLIGAYNVAQLERKALIDANVPVTNPAVRQFEDQIERLRISALESLRNLRNNISSSISRLAEMNNRIRSQISTLPLKEQNLMEIKTQQEAKQTVVNLLLEKREQTAIALAGTISNMKVIEEARPNTIPVKPDRKTIYMMALLGGLAIPALFIFIGEMLNDKVNSRYDVEKATTVPIAGEIGHSFGKEPLVVKPNNRGLVAEQFRIIRSNLQYLLHNIEKPVILITSSFSGEGKSYVSTNLGAVLSLANKKTIILEFDIRKPKILSHLNMSKKPGIINFLLGKAEVKDLPVNVPGYEHLFVLPCGPVPPNPSELLLDPKLDDLFAYLKANFDTIIIDTAPIGMVSDAMALSRFADNTLYVVRQGYTYKKQIGLIEDFHVNGKMPRMSILINDVKARMGYGYYGYGKYGYGYGEKSGYFEEEKKPKTLMNKWFGWLDTKKWDKQKTKV